MLEQRTFRNYYAFILISNLFCWVLAIWFCSVYFFKISYCLIAYSLGIRHALDADHVSAIDNITRKFIQEKKEARKVGLLFSMGHSSIVVTLSAMLAILPHFSQSHFSYLKKLGDVLGNSSSIFFLLLLSCYNINLCFKILNTMNKKKGKKIQLLSTGYSKKIYNCINTDLSIYIIGILFGLSFDSATEVALLGLASMDEVTDNIYFIFLLPLLFSTGMCFVDTAINQLSSTICHQFLNEKYRRINLHITTFIAVSGLFIAIYEFQNFIMTQGQHFISILALPAQYTAQNFEWIGVLITLPLALCYLLFRFR